MARGLHTAAGLPVKMWAGKGIAANCSLTVTGITTKDTLLSVVGWKPSSGTGLIATVLNLTFTISAAGTLLGGAVGSEGYGLLVAYSDAED